MQSERHEPKLTRRKKLAVSLGLLLLSPVLCCAGLWLGPYLPGTNDFYFLVTGRYYADLVEDKVPEYDRLNDELLDNLPVYPGAVPIPETKYRVRPDQLEFGGGPAGPRTLEICYQVDASMGQVVAFYECEMQSLGWRLTKTHLGYVFTKNDACVSLKKVSVQRRNSYRPNSVLQIGSIL